MNPLRTRRRLLEGLAAGLLPSVMLPVVRPARAATFPERTVRIVVPYAPGVGPDVVAAASPNGWRGSGASRWSSSEGRITRP